MESHGQVFFLDRTTRPRTNQRGSSDKMSGKEKIREQLSAYLDGELTQKQSRRVAETVRDDPALASELESIRAVQSLVRQLPFEQAPSGLTESVLARVGGKTADRAAGRSAGWWMGRLARAAVVLLAVGVGATVTTLLNRPSQTGPTGPQTPEAGHVLKTSGLVKPSFGDVDGAALAMVTNLFINTDDLKATQREVERVFGNNSIRPIVEVADKSGTASVEQGQRQDNFYRQSQVAPTQVCYEITITKKQLRRIVTELNEIRARQNVAQIPLMDDLPSGVKSDSVVLAKADYRSRGGVRGGMREAAEKDKEGRRTDKSYNKNGVVSRLPAKKSELAKLEGVDESKKHRRESAGDVKARDGHFVTDTDKKPTKSLAEATAGKIASKTALAAKFPAATPTRPAEPSGIVRSDARTTPATQTSRPSALVAGRRSRKAGAAGEKLQIGFVRRRATTSAAGKTGNMRQLVVILNVVTRK